MKALLGLSDGQYQGTAIAAAIAAKVADVAGRGIDEDVVGSGARDHAGGKGNGQLGGAVDGGGKRRSIENDDGSGDKLTAIHSKVEGGHYLSKGNTAG